MTPLELETQNKMLAHFGEQGWELVSFHLAPASNGSPLALNAQQGVGLLWVFKRPKARIAV